MASGYEAATEDIRSLVASTLDVATQRDRAFVAGVSQALTNWTEKYQQAMSQGENQSLHDQLARWDQVQKAGVTLSQKITSLTTDYEPGTVSSEIFRALLPDCFRRIWARTKVTFQELHATLPTLLCQFVAPDQAGQMLSAIFTCMCNYNTEDLWDGHGPDRSPGLHHSQYLPGPAISLGEYMLDHPRYSSHQRK